MRPWSSTGTTTTAPGWSTTSRRTLRPEATSISSTRRLTTRPSENCRVPAAGGALDLVDAQADDAALVDRLAADEDGEGPVGMRRVGSHRTGTRNQEQG